MTAFSSSPTKEEEARQFGADAFVVTRGEGSLETHADSYDFLLCTVTADLPWGEYLNVLRPGGKLCIVGVPENDVKIPALPLILGQKSVVSSVIGSRSEMQAMLEFSARHNIQPRIERFPMQEVNMALERLRCNQVRYRAVLENPA